jgi:hypothetical protein
MGAISKQAIIGTGQKMTWIHGRDSVKSRGGLPSYGLVESIIKSHGGFEGIISLLWLRELTAYPEFGGEFAEGRDFNDATAEKVTGVSWVMPAASIPKEAAGRKSVGLFFEPEEVEVGGGSIIIHANPDRVKIISPYSESTEITGAIGHETGFPLGISMKEGQANQRNTLVFRRLESAGLRPLAFSLKHGDRSILHANCRQDAVITVAYVETMLQAVSGMADAAGE